MNRDNTSEIPGTPGADSELPMLTATQAAHLRELAAPHFREGHHQSLLNLGSTCRQAPESRWPELVAAHFAALRQASTGGESAEELLRGTHARLLPLASLTQDLVDDMRYARVVADGLVFAYALDGPTSVRILTDADVERAGLRELGQAAYTNLLSVPVTHEEVSVAGRARVHSLHGDSPFVASKALFLSEVAPAGDRRAAAARRRPRDRAEPAPAGLPPDRRRFRGRCSQRPGLVRPQRSRGGAGAAVPPGLLVARRRTDIAHRHR
ncbi:hypothetical protein ABT246_39875 [Streptomyces sp. NPDC001553]|uniref:hypothetical protein n=1 Tax=Streptomyces sp. NPDC001553 TaxID=3154385 RepID=UPI0033257EE7